MSAQNWIPATQRSPEPLLDVLVTWVSDLLDGPAVDMAFVNPAGHWLLTGSVTPIQVTHWMPLPEPAEEAAR
ncbi:DUF551 domain-containing protein [Sedimenticola hydrogenitrophicus]|uniref:DUF551 domain-containing protein n=1 Tax=Sedimenticola hydrogenitrophicus TaxID=2967975 RepID=UPI0023B03895|nr:DUF551 domain-containing protein [Sedimenticola hydrogenitrophicus]